MGRPSSRSCSSDQVGRLRRDPVRYDDDAPGRHHCVQLRQPVEARTLSNAHRQGGLTVEGQQPPEYNDRQ